MEDRKLEKTTTSGKQISKAPLSFVFQNLSKIRGDRMGVFDRLVKTYGDVVSVQLGPVLLNVFNRPECAQHILQSNQKNYVKDPILTGPAEMFTGRTMFTSDGDSWLMKRRLMQPAFHRRRLGRFGKISVEATERMLARWRNAGNEPLDMQVEMANLTLEVVGLALFSVDLTDKTTKLGEAFMIGNNFVIYRIDIPFAPPLWVPIPKNQTFKSAMKIIDEFIYGLIDSRISDPSNGETKDDLLMMLLEAQDEDTGEKMSKDQIRNELISLFSAGHDTTASTLMWTLYLLSENPDAEAKLLQEIDSVLGDRTPTMDDLPALTYTRQVIDESLRLYPPAWALTRVAVEDDNVGGWSVPAGGQVTIPIASIHRHSQFWEDAHLFRPERFDPNSEISHHKFAYLPFGGGSRQCIGSNFALTEATLTLATLLRQITLKLVPNHPVETKTVVGLHARHGIPMTLHWRK